MHAPRWLLINSGNANAGTGKRGLADASQTCVEVANLASDAANRVLPFSTGVIGQALPVHKITAALPAVFQQLSENHWTEAATAIMTTDTFPKGVSMLLDVDGQKITITGIAKGAGMIQPDMATMLSFIATDARIEQRLLQNLLATAVDQSFNLITVDGDTSTNDACVLMASGSSKAPELKEGTASFQQFSEALTVVCKQLAEAIIRDGEGATKLMRIVVEQAHDEVEACGLLKPLRIHHWSKLLFLRVIPIGTYPCRCRSGRR